MEVKLIMQECNYCGHHNSYEDFFSLKKWANGSYCSSECIFQDMIKHEALINYYDNEIKSLSKEEDTMNDKLNKSLQRRTALMQKLTGIKSLMKTGKLKYND